MRFVFIITLLVFLSLQRANILAVDAAWNAVGNENGIKKTSGNDENENKESPRLENFRTLLGLKSLNMFHTRRLCYSVFKSNCVSLSASLSSKTQAEPPNSELHVHPGSYHSHRSMPLHEIQQQDRGSANRTTLVAVVVSGVVATLICALGCVCVCKRFRNQKWKPNRTMPLFRKNGRTAGTCHNSSSNVSLNSDPDLLSLKQTCETKSGTSSRSSLKRAINEEKVLNQEEHDNASTASSSATKETLSVHEDLEYDGGGKASSAEKTDPEPCHSSSDYESFHSCVETEPLFLSPRNLISETTQFPCSSNNSTPKVESNQSPSTPKDEEQKRSETSQSSIPPPPSPPPFLKRNMNNSVIKTPPSQQLPKLKPLHWDKVRATPDRTMVWDTLRTNSFE